MPLQRAVLASRSGTKEWLLRVIRDSDSPGGGYLSADRVTRACQPWGDDCGAIRVRAVRNMSTPLVMARGNLRRVVNAAWKRGRIDGRDVIHVFKTLLAVIAATGISMRLELAAPRTATVTVVILMMHRHSGMVIARGFYRALGMLIGNLAAMILIGSLVQERVLFLLTLSAWIGLCVCGAAYYRNYQSYGFVLAGYATCIAALPSIDDPYAIFGNVVTGLSEVSLGVLCASVVSALILPESVQGGGVRISVFKAG